MQHVVQKAVNVWPFSCFWRCLPRFISIARSAMQRLKSWPQFQAVLNGEVVTKTAHFALHRLTLSETQVEIFTLFPGCASWVGAMAPKRLARRAVTRNAIKTQIYSLSASLTPSSASCAFVVRLRREFSREDYMSASSAALKKAVRTELFDLLSYWALPDPGSAKL